MRADGFCPLPAPLLPPDPASYDFGLPLLSPVPLAATRPVSLALFRCSLSPAALFPFVQSYPIQKSRRHPLRGVLSRLLPTPKISRDSSNHPVHPSATCTVVLSVADNHLWSLAFYRFRYVRDAPPIRNGATPATMELGFVN